MLIQRFKGPNAVLEGERFGLSLVSKNPHVAHWLPVCYNVADHEFKNPINAIFEYNHLLNKVTKHTIFSKYISDIVYYSNIKNIPLNINSDLISIFFAALFILTIYL
jgi:hypothetical protein